MGQLLFRRRGTAAALVAALAASLAAAPDRALARDRGESELSSVGAPEMGGLMDRLFTAFSRTNPDLGKSRTWLHRTDAQAIGALMYEQADIAPMIREFDRGELAPYDHQFRGDMMKAPVMVPIALRAGQPVWLAVNRRPGAPLAADVRRFLAFALGSDGQAVIADTPGFGALPAAAAQAERDKLAGFVAALDPAIPSYRATAAVRGEISSIGSDGMKSLMDRWMDEFARLQPDARRGERWEHPGTLNGFHALLHGLADLAPMGRELWPQEAAGYAAATGIARPLEIRVARGGFNTPQRTTAQVIFVHPDNPVQAITVPQLRGILSDDPAITRWGQLGATGAWADRPIQIYMPPQSSPNAMSIQLSVLGGQPWNKAARAGSISDTASALAGDPAGIAFGGLEEGGPGLKSLAVAPAAGQPAIPADYDTASDGRYPLTRFMYIRLTRRSGEAVRAPLREFLRYVLSREGQQSVVASGYFPLTETELREERAKLD